MYERATYLPDQSYGPKSGEEANAVDEQMTDVGNNRRCFALQKIVRRPFDKEGLAWLELLFRGQWVS